MFISNIKAIKKALDYIYYNSCFIAGYAAGLIAVELLKIIINEVI